MWKVKFSIFWCATKQEQPDLGSMKNRGTLGVHKINKSLQPGFKNSSSSNACQ